MKYHYCSRDLHKEPERYYFSKTGDKSFIASFLNIRKIRIDQLVTLSESISLPDKSFESITLNLLYSSQPCLSKYSHLADYELKTNSNFFKNSIHIEDSIDVRTTLYEILHRQLKSGINSEEEYILDQLTRKFEIYRRIYGHYASDFRKKGTLCNDMTLYSLLSINLLVRCSKTNNFKFLNAALKINDVLVSQEAPNSFGCLLLFIACLVMEDSLLHTLCENQDVQLN